MMSHSVIEKWDKIQELLRDESDISKISYKTFLENLEPIRVHDNTIIIKTDDEIGRDYIERKYSKSIIIAIREIVGEIYNIKFMLPSEIEREEKRSSGKRQPTINNNEYNSLNSRYTFDTFVVGNNNKLAHAAALAVAESPAEAYNPLFIYGGVGLGKTHLMHSIAHFILSENSESKVLYVSSEKFTNELINSIRDDKNEEFRQKYRNIDVLLVDDIQFIAGKESTQEEFFHTFNTLHESNKQIIISSDRPPKEIPTLEDRLRSRFEWGLITDIQPPDLETRIAILRKKAESENYDVPDEVITYIAQNIQSNIRKLEGALIRIFAYSSLTNKKEVNLELAQEALKHLISNNKKITVKDIQEAVSNYYNISIEDLLSKKKPKNISFPRQVAMYISRKLTELSLPKLGEEFGGRDHSTVLHAYNKISNDLDINIELKKAVDDIISVLNN